MKKLIVSSCFALLFSTTLLGSQLVTSTLQGSRINFLPEEGSVVKKGEPLVIFGMSSTMAKIAGIKAKLQGAEANLKDKSLDLERYTKLKESNSASAEKLETTDISYDKAVYNIAKYKAEIKSLEEKVKISVIPAPYDCKIQKVFVLQNSGTEFGQEIMELEAVSDTQKSISDNPTDENIRTVTSPIYGCVATYLAPEGTIVKKGELLVKLQNLPSEALIDGLKAEILYAEQSVAVNKQAYERYNKLKGTGTSMEYFQDAQLAYEEAKYKLELAKKNLSYNQGYNASGTIFAPFDCKVTKVIITLNSGAEAGTSIMEIVPVEESNGAKSKTSENTLAVTSLLDEQSIAYLADEGQIIKKGEVLVRLDPSTINDEIDMAKLDLTYAELNLKDKERDFKRCKYLTEKKSNSIEECGNYELEYNIAKSELEECKANLNYYERKKEKTVITAPYDCKVTKVLTVVGGGVWFGTAILEVEKS